MLRKDRRGGCVGEFVDSMDAFPSDKKRILANLDCTEKNEKENAIYFANASFLLLLPPVFRLLSVPPFVSLFDRARSTIRDPFLSVLCYDCC